MEDLPVEYAFVGRCFHYVRVITLKLVLVFNENKDENFDVVWSSYNINILLC